jgi:hypothetical protein
VDLNLVVRRRCHVQPVRLPRTANIASAALILTAILFRSKEGAGRVHRSTRPRSSRMQTHEGSRWGLFA